MSQGFFFAHHADIQGPREQLTSHPLSIWLSATSWDLFVETVSKAVGCDVSGYTELPWSLCSCIVWWIYTQLQVKVQDQRWCSDLLGINIRALLTLCLSATTSFDFLLSPCNKYLTSCTILTCAHDYIITTFIKYVYISGQSLFLIHVNESSPAVLAGFVCLRRMYICK